MHKADCPFCSINIVCRVFLCREHCFAFLSRHGVSPGQTLVVPKRHVSTLEELYPHEVSDLMLGVSEAISMLRRNGIALDCNVAINLGEVAGQSIQHLHIHIIPRVSGDTLQPNRWLSDDLFKLLEEKNDVELISLAVSLRRDSMQKSKEIEADTGVCGYGEIDDVCDATTFTKSARINVDYFNENLKVSIGNRSLIRSGTVIYRNVRIDSGFECGHNVLIRENVRIGKDVCLYGSTQVHRGVVIGNNSVVGGWLGNGAIIGNNVRMFGQLVHDYSSRIRGVDEPAPVILDNAFIGWNAVVVGGVTVGRGSVVGAGSVVLTDVSDGCTAVGNPARIIGRPS